MKTSGSRSMDKLQKCSIVKEEHASPAAESRLSRFLEWYNRVPVLRKTCPSSVLSLILAMIIITVMRLVFPPGQCTCEEQFTDPKLKALADSGNREARQYLAQKDNPINCAGRRKELLERIEKEKSKSRSGP